MIKVSAGIAYDQNQPMAMASALIAQFIFLAKSALKYVVQIFFQTKVVKITIHNFWCKNCFDHPTGLASALIAQFVFLAKSALKMRRTKFFFRQKLLPYKSETTTFMLCNIFRCLAPFWSYSGLLNTSRKFCAVLRNSFFPFAVLISVRCC